MDKHELIAAMREAFDKQIGTHHILDVRPREMDFYLNNYIDNLEKALDEMEEKSDE